MDEFIQIAKENGNTKKELVEQLQLLKPLVSAGKGEVLQTIREDSVVSNEAINIMGDRMMDLEDEVESKKIETNEMYGTIGPKLHKNVTKLI